MLSKLHVSLAFNHGGCVRGSASNTLLSSATSCGKNQQVRIYLSFYLVYTGCFHCIYCFSYNLTCVCLFLSTVLYHQQQRRHVLYQDHCQHGNSSFSPRSRRLQQQHHVNFWPSGVSNNNTSMPDACNSNTTMSHTMSDAILCCCWRQRQKITPALLSRKQQYYVWELPRNALRAKSLPIYTHKNYAPLELIN